MAIHLAWVVDIALSNPRDAGYTLLLFVVLGLLYFVWKRYDVKRNGAGRF